MGRSLRTHIAKPASIWDAFSKARACRSVPIAIPRYWPHATTLFDYIRRAMPFAAPGSLSADETYAVSAYILTEAQIIDKSMVLDAKTLPLIEMPNRNGFVPDPRPEIFK